jgi:hypothetical protein
LGLVLTYCEGGFLRSICFRSFSAFSTNVRKNLKSESQIFSLEVDMREGCVSHLFHLNTIIFDCDEEEEKEKNIIETIFGSAGQVCL